METLSRARTSVFLVEDSAPIRERLTGMLGEIDGVSVVGEADTASAAVEGILRTRPDSVVLDIQLTQGSGIEVLRKVHRLAPQVVFIVLSNHANPQYRRLCTEAGASHFLDKSSQFGTVVEVVAALAARAAESETSERGIAMEAAAKLRAPAEAATTMPSPAAQVAKVATQCSACALRGLCLPCGLTGQEMDCVDALIYTRRRVKRGDSLYRAGDSFSSLYAVRSGCFKNVQTLEDGRDQVTGFSMAGEIMGMDGIGPETHGCSAVALEDSEVCVIPYSRLESLGRDMPVLQRQFHKVMSGEIVREHGVMLLLGTMRAEERLAAFLLNLSQRLKARGYSATDFNLRMTRDEIGSYLGLKLETVSRIFSKFQEDGLISVQQKHIGILDPAGLRRVMGQLS